MSAKRKYDGDHNARRKPNQLNGFPQQRPESSQLMYKTTPVLPPIDEKYEISVFTHPSITSQEPDSGKMISYDRLEFLGDSYLQTIATRAIWERCENFPVGKMARTREMLVKNETLSKFSVLYGFDRKLKLARNKETEHGPTRIKINGDIFEAYIAAIILSDPEGGFKSAENWLTELWEPLLRQSDITTTDVKSKSELARKILAPGVQINYVDEKPRTVHKGQGIESYFIGVYMTGWGMENQHLGSGTGLSKSGAGMAAAAQALMNIPLIDEIAAKKQDHYSRKREDEQNMKNVESGD